MRAFIEAHHASLPKTDKPRSGSSSSAASSTTNEVMHGPTPPTLSRLGTGLRRESPHPDDRPTTPTPPAMDSQEPLVSPISPISPSNGTNASASAHGPIGGGGGARAGSVGSEAGGKPAMPRLERVTTDVRNEMEASAKKDGYADGDFKLADALMPMHLNKGSKEEFKSVLDDQLGPWRFSDPGTDMIEVSPPMPASRRRVLGIAS